MKYNNGNGGDIGIGECRSKAGEEPKIKDNRYGFTENFQSESEARRFAVAVAKELDIKTCIRAERIAQYE